MCAAALGRVRRQRSQQCSCTYYYEPMLTGATNPPAVDRLHSSVQLTSPDANNNFARFLCRPNTNRNPQDNDPVQESGRCGLVRLCVRCHSFFFASDIDERLISYISWCGILHSALHQILILRPEAATPLLFGKVRSTYEI